MYGRNITFTLLAPSLWSVVQAIASNIEEEKYNRMLFKTGDNNGFIIEVFENIKFRSFYIIYVYTLTFNYRFYY